MYQGQGGYNSCTNFGNGFVKQAYVQKQLCDSIEHSSEQNRQTMKYIK